MHALRQETLHKHHVFDMHISNMTLTNDQQYVLDNILQNHMGLYVLTGTSGSDKTFFCRILGSTLSTITKKMY